MTLKNSVSKKKNKNSHFGRLDLSAEKRYYTLKVILLFLLFIICVVSLLPARNCEAADPLKVYVVNYPLKYFTERIGEDHVEVIFPAPPSIDPAYWIPDIPAILAYQQADLILLNGAGYAKWVDKVTLPQSKLIDTSKEFKDRYITIKGAITHSHGPEGEHAHEGIAFTTWLDFELAVKQAEAILFAVNRKIPEKKRTFEKNFKSLKADLMALDKELMTIVSNASSKPLVASHPVYDYLARRYRLNIKSVHWEPKEIPNREQLDELQNILNDYKAQWMIWEGEPNPESVMKLRSIGVDSLVFDPSSNVPEKGDFLSIMWQNVENLRLAFK
jgi:zinc transport system substrate-binding protein